ncbi:hypothetical protein HAX54_001311 [Datura stramonium]|uniref:Uncharacterized protein n=1 Tax=Datura stramonium TaxID=4076 RepID=A0ABS8RSF0_DATST|nr:hypothetical protein [Datura stramonium]
MELSTDQNILIPCEHKTCTSLKIFQDKVSKGALNVEVSYSVDGEILPFPAIDRLLVESREKRYLYDYLKSFGTVQLGYGIKKLDGRYYQQLFHLAQGIELFSPVVIFLPFSIILVHDKIKKFYVRDEDHAFEISCHDAPLGKLMQMTVMTPPSFNIEHIEQRRPPTSMAFG